MFLLAFLYGPGGMLNDFPVRQSITIDRPVMIVGTGEEDQRANKRRKNIYQEPLGLRVDQDILRIPEIEKRALPREDGREWDFWQQTSAEEAKRPYGKSYLKDQVERHEILAADPSYRFISDVAGALRKEPFELFEEEDMQRLMAEQQAERLRNELDMKRTRLSAQEKYDMIGKMRRLLDSLIKEQTQRDSQLPPEQLLYTSRFIIDHNELPSTVVSNNYYGFQSLVREVALFNADPQRIQSLIDNEIDLDDRVLLTSDDGTRGRLFYHLFVYFDHFLDNDTSEDRQEALRVKLRYLVDYLPKFSQATTSATKIDVYYEETIEKMARELETSNPWRDATLFYNDVQKTTTPDGEEIEWKRYKGTETINLAHFSKMTIAIESERRMATMGIESMYKSKFPEYSRNILLFLYGDDEAKERVLRGNGKQGLNLTSNDVEDGGHPPQIVALIQRQFDTFRTSKPLGAISQIVRSHLLWLFFNNIPWTSVVQELLGDAPTIIPQVSRVFVRYSSLLNATIELYKPLLWVYLRDVTAYLLASRADNNRPVLVLPLNVKQLLTQPRPKGIITLKEDATAFDMLNQAFGGLQESDLLGDALFYRYLTNGNAVFVDRLADIHSFEPRHTKSDAIVVGDTIEALMDVISAYPALRLHVLFRLYASYLNAYSVFITENLELLRASIDKTRNKLAKMVANESVSQNGDKEVEYRQRRSFTTQPINSGYVKLKAEMTSLISRAYHKVQESVPTLRGLPLEGFHCDSAYDTGLTSAMVAYISVIAAENELNHPDQFKSKHQYLFIRQKMNETMTPLRQFSYNTCGNNDISWYCDDNARPSPTYVITRTLKRSASNAFHLPYLSHTGGGSPSLFML
jgi:hypothetical protein